MKIGLTILFLGLIAANPAVADPRADRLTVAVYDFQGETDAAVYGRKVTSLVTADLAMRTNLIMLERADLEKALREQAFGASGMVSSDAAAKIGQMTGAKVLVAGQVITLGNNRLTLIGNIIGTETGRLFAAKVDGPADHLMELTAELGAKISKTIIAESNNLVSQAEESHAQRVRRILESIKGTNRPSVSVSIIYSNEYGGRWHDNPAEYEFSAVLLKAGFPVMDEHSDSKPDIEITGDAGDNFGSPQGDLISGHAAIELKIQERRTGRIIAFDHQEATGTGIGKSTASMLSHSNCADDLAERILPLLAK